MHEEVNSWGQLISHGKSKPLHEAWRRLSAKLTTIPLSNFKARSLNTILLEILHMSLKLRQRFLVKLILNFQVTNVLKDYNKMFLLRCCIIKKYWEEPPLFTKFPDIILFLKVSSMRLLLAQTDWLDILFTGSRQTARINNIQLLVWETFLNPVLAIMQLLQTHTHNP